MDKQKATIPAEADGEAEHLMKASAEGRLIVLPCAVGDVIYRVMDGKARPQSVVSIAVLLSDVMKHIEIHAENGRGAITSVSTADLGVNVFLTRDEAEDEITCRMGGRRCYACDYWTQADPRCLCEKSQWFLAVVQPDNYCGYFETRNDN